MALLPDLSNVARSAYDLAFQISPIILTGGIASQLPGQATPVIALIGQIAGIAQSFITNGIGLSSIGVRFVPMAGATVISNIAGTYPFANQQTAGNALVSQPLTISLEMIAPVNSDGGYITKLAIFTALRESFAAHNAAGGTYSIATPSYIYTNCLMTGITDVTGGNTRQQQINWQIDFVKPLLAQQDASNAESALISKLTNGQQQTSAGWSNITGVAGTQGAVAGVTSLTGNALNFLATPLL